MSPANIIGSKISDARFKSSTKIKNNNGPNIDSYVWETTFFNGERRVFVIKRGKLFLVV